MKSLKIAILLLCLTHWFIPMGVARVLCITTDGSTHIHENVAEHCCHGPEDTHDHEADHDSREADETQEGLHLESGPCCTDIPLDHNLVPATHKSHPTDLQTTLTKATVAGSFQSNLTSQTASSPVISPHQWLSSVILLI